MLQYLHTKQFFKKNPVPIESYCAGHFCKFLPVHYHKPTKENDTVFQLLSTKPVISYIY